MNTSKKLFAKPWRHYVDFIAITASSEADGIVLFLFNSFVVSQKMVSRMDTHHEITEYCKSCCQRQHCQKICYEQHMNGVLHEFEYIRTSNGMCKLNTAVQSRKVLPKDIDNQLSEKQLALTRNMYKRKLQMPPENYGPIVNKCRRQCESHICEGNCLYRTDDHPFDKFIVTYPAGTIRTNLQCLNDWFPYTWWYRTWKFFFHNSFSLNITFLHVEFAQPEYECHSKYGGGLNIEEKSELSHVNCYTSTCGRPAQIAPRKNHQDETYTREVKFLEKRGTFSDLKTGELNRERKLHKFCGSHSTFAWFSESNDVEIYLAIEHNNRDHYFDLRLEFQVIYPHQIVTTEPRNIMPSEPKLFIVYHIVKPHMTVSVFNVKMLEIEEVCFDHKQVHMNTIFVFSGPILEYSRRGETLAGGTTCTGTFQSFLVVTLPKKNFTNNFIHLVTKERSTSKCWIKDDKKGFWFNSTIKEQPSSPIEIISLAQFYLGATISKLEQLGPPTSFCNFAGVAVFDSSSSSFFKLLTLCRRFNHTQTPGSNNHSFSIFSSQKSLTFVSYLFHETAVLNRT